MRHFTPEEANAELEHVRPLVEQLVATRQEHAAALERQEELERKIRGNGGGIPPATRSSRTQFAQKTCLQFVHSSSASTPS